MTRQSRAKRSPKRRARSSDLIGNVQPLTARSVLATALLGADEPRLRVAELVAAAALFGISPGAARTCLSRMVASGELTSDNASYALAGRLLERRERIDDAARPAVSSTQRWNGTWELAIVSLDRRSAAERLELRKAASALHLAELREGVWLRPDNLDPQRLATARNVLDQQCVYFRDAAADISLESVRALFSLDAWSRTALRLIHAMRDELEVVPIEREDVTAALSYQFALSIVVVRHLQLDPLLPAVLLPDAWPASSLRSTYRRFDDTFKQRMISAFR